MFARHVNDGDLVGQYLLAHIVVLDCSVFAGSSNVSHIVDEENRTGVVNVDDSGSNGFICQPLVVNVHVQHTSSDGHLNSLTQRNGFGFAGGSGSNTLALAAPGNSGPRGTDERTSPRFGQWFRQV